MRPMGQGCPSNLRVNGSLAAALVFLNCCCLGSVIWKGDNLLYSLTLQIKEVEAQRREAIHPGS